ncbi:MAG: membrane protein insertion efficiency factor YidD [Saprospiraceae bacterium]|nr:membrane protein insertion efficiency factor YidD [Saprospiraceae bacterium]
MISKILKRLLILPVRIYQMILSPLMPARCRYSPTCSQYMIEAINEWGPLKGLIMGLKRVASCHPWGGHGHETKKKRDKK